MNTKMILGALLASISAASAAPSAWDCVHEDQNGKRISIACSPESQRGLEYVLGCQTPHGPKSVAMKKGGAILSYLDDEYARETQAGWDSYTISGMYANGTIGSGEYEVPNYEIVLCNSSR